MGEQLRELGNQLFKRLDVMKMMIMSASMMKNLMLDLLDLA